MRLLFFVAALLAAGPAAAACESRWYMPTAQVMTLAPDGEFRRTHFASGELHAVSRGGQEKPGVELLYVRAASGGAILVKGVVAAEVDRVARDSPWVMLESAPVLGVLDDAFRKLSPCGEPGRYAAVVKPQAASNETSSRFVGATVTAFVERPGEVSFDIRFPGAPAPVVAGKLTYLDPAPALPDATDVGGFSVVRGGEETFVAPLGMTAAELRARLSQGKR